MCKAFDCVTEERVECKGKGGEKVEAAERIEEE